MEVSLIIPSIAGVARGLILFLFHACVDNEKVNVARIMVYQVFRSLSHRLRSSDYSDLIKQKTNLTRYGPRSFRIATLAV